MTTRIVSILWAILLTLLLACDAKANVESPTAADPGLQFVIDIEHLPGPFDQPTTYEYPKDHPAWSPEYPVKCLIGHGYFINEGPCGQYPEEETSAIDYMKEKGGPEGLLKEVVQLGACRFVDEYVTVPLEKHQRDALCSYTYNTFQGDEILWSMVEQSGLNDGNYDIAQDILHSDAPWIPENEEETGVSRERHEHLLKKRCDQAQLWANGDYTVQLQRPCPKEPTVDC